MDRKWRMNIPILESGITNLFRCVINITCSFKLGYVAMNSL